MRCTRTTTAALLAVCTAAGLPATRAAADAEATWYARKLTGGDTPLRVEHFWSKGRKLRTETVVAGRPLITIVDGSRYHVIDALAGGGIAIERSAEARAADARGERPFGKDVARLLELGAEKVRVERVQGRLCDVYRLTDARGRREVWVTQDELRLPVRTEAYDRLTKVTVRADYLDWARGLPVPDAFFEPDSRWKLQKIDYDEYLSRSRQGPVGPAPVLHSDLLHGSSGPRLAE